MRDKLYLVLALIGFLIITAVVVINYDTTQDGKPFNIGGYYTPREVKNKTDSSIDLVRELNGSRKLTCPQPTLQKTVKSTFNLSTLHSTNYENIYGAKTLFVTLDTTGLANGVNLSGIDNASLKSALNIKSDILPTGTFKLGDLWDIGENSYVELIAPFNFVFANVNTTSPTTIVIVNSKGNCKITFDNVANWFCAGTVGSTQVTASGTKETVTSWEDHKNNHHSIIGATTNSSVTAGSTKDIIGYGTADTTVKIEKYTNNQYTEIDLKNFITSTIKK